MRLHSIVAALSFIQAAFAFPSPDASLAPHKSVARIWAFDGADSGARTLDLAKPDVPLEGRAWRRRDVQKERHLLNARADNVPPQSTSLPSIPFPASPQERFRLLAPIHSGRFIPGMQAGKTYAFELTFLTAPLPGRIFASITHLRHMLGYAHKGLLVGKVTADMGFVGLVYDQVTFPFEYEAVRLWL